MASASVGPSACLLGKKWGYDNAGVWVADGCGGEFTLGQAAAGASASKPMPATQTFTDFYPFNTRNHRWNLQIQKVNRSPVGSTFGYYVGGLDGTIVSTGVLGVV